MCSFLFVYNPFISHLIYSVKYKNAKKQKNIKSLIIPLLYNSPTLSHKQRAESSRKFTSSSGQLPGRTRTIVRLIKTQPGCRQGEIFFPWAAALTWGLTRTIVRLVSQAARRSPNPIQALRGAARRIYVYIGYAARYSEQLWGLIPIPIRCPIPMITRTIHRFIFLAACCAPNLPWQRPDNPNNLSGYAQGLRFSERESPR